MAWKKYVPQPDIRHVQPNGHNNASQSAFNIVPLCSNVQAFVDVRGCDYSNLNLKTKVFSGVLMRGANFENSTFVGTEFARADAKGANFRNADFTDINGYSANFDGVATFHLS